MVDGLNTISIEKALAFPNGDIVAFCLMNSQYAGYCCEPWELPPQVLITHDLGETWDEPFPFNKYNGRIYDAFIHDGVGYVLQSCDNDFLSQNEKGPYLILEQKWNSCCKNRNFGTPSGHSGRIFYAFFRSSTSAIHSDALALFSSMMWA